MELLLAELPLKGLPSCTEGRTELLAAGLPETAMLPCRGLQERLLLLVLLAAGLLLTGLHPKATWLLIKHRLLESLSLCRLARVDPVIDEQLPWP